MRSVALQVDVGTTPMSTVAHALLDTLPAVALLSDARGLDRLAALERGQPALKSMK